jgi:hypothetical protein
MSALVILVRLVKFRHLFVKVPLYIFTVGGLYLSGQNMTNVTNAFIEGSRGGIVSIYPST